MPNEWTGPNPEEILHGFIHSGRSEVELQFVFAALQGGIKEGTIRSQISCLEDVRGFFEMANRIYVRNEGPILSDAELGMHQAQCESPICKRLLQAYYEVLQPSQETNSEIVAQKLKLLASEIMLGKLRSDLEGRESVFFDSQTGADLFEVKVVDITDKCTVDPEFEAEMKGATDGSQREVLLCYVPYSGGMMCDIRDGYGGSFSARAYDILVELSPSLESAFKVHAARVGIDSDLLKAIMIANAPKFDLTEDSS